MIYWINATVVVVVVDKASEGRATAGALVAYTEPTSSSSFTAATSAQL